MCWNRSTRRLGCRLLVLCGLSSRFSSVVCVEVPFLLRAIEIYQTNRLDFAEAYLVAGAESTGVNRIASFDRSIDLADPWRRREVGVRRVRLLHPHRFAGNVRRRCIEASARWRYMRIGVNANTLASVS